MTRTSLLLSFSLLLAPLAGGYVIAQQVAPAPAPAPASSPAPQAAPQEYAVVVLGVRPHDRQAFTQGLLWHDGRLYESTGLEGQSTLRIVDPLTGTVEKRVKLSDEYFAEGLVLVDDRLIQLTWKNGKAFVYDVNTLEKTGEFDYEGEGWGLAYDGTHLLMSDGSDKITLRDPKTFEKIGDVSVTFQGRPVNQLNELEYVNGVLYANVWMQEVIVMIDVATGHVKGVIDASGLLSPADRATADVLNGIAYNPETSTFLITGKRWPRMFEVQFARTK